MRPTLAGPQVAPIPDDALALICLMHDAPAYEPNLELLSAGERERAGRYRLEQKRRQFLFTRSAGREVLGSLFQIPPHQVGWSLSGPPCVSCGEGEILESLSIAHSGSISALAIGRSGLRVGIDLEQVDSSLRCEALSQIALTAGERREMSCLPRDLQGAFLLRSWTIKEAVLKCLRSSPVPHPQSLQLHWKHREGAPDLCDHILPETSQQASGLKQQTLSHLEWMASARQSVLSSGTVGDVEGRPGGPACGWESRWYAGWIGSFAKQEGSGNLSRGVDALAIVLSGAELPAEPSPEPELMSRAGVLKISKIHPEELNFPGNASFGTDVFKVTIAIPLPADALAAD